MICHRAALLVALTSIATGVGASQQEGYQTGGAAMAPAQEAALVSACVASQQQAAALADGLTRQLEFARQTNAPANMRIAMDGLQAALVEMRTALRKCDPLQAAAATSDGQRGHNNMMSMQPPAVAAPQTAMKPGSTTAEMDHSKMAKEGTAAKPSAAAGGKPAGSMSGMDHSKMAKEGTAAKPSGVPGAKPAGSMAGMDHSKMPTGGAAAKPSAPAAGKPAAPMAGMDHSKMGMGSAAPKAGGHGATSGTAKLPVTMAERVADPACPSNVGHADAATAVYQKKVYYFCSTADRDRFRKDPAAYLKKRPR